MAAGGEHGTKAIVAAFFANLGIAIAKFVGFIVTGSTSMLAESVHSVADTGNQALLLLGGRRARREPTPLHPFGFGRERYFWSFVVALVLFSLGSLFAIYEGVHKLEVADDHSEEISYLVNYVILSVAILLEAFSLRTAVVESNKVRGSQSWSQFVRRAKSPELPVVLLEDIGAMAGLVIALSALITADVTGDVMWDGIGTLAIGGLLGIIAIFLAIEMKGLLIGEAADEDVQRAITGAMSADEGVKRVIYSHTQHIGPEEVLVAAKVEFSSSLSGRELADTIDRIEASVRQAAPVATAIFLEPDISRD
ncbi:MAG: cation diffusion facilitator family transporter [Actinomycetota bacterium]|nr:cation diffusion facilitator family transporter [Acidimicrobiia bacterium]MDQ3292951.1 cation diffusion facilitator family transporter [Actinomycetota bacterium]